VSDSTTVKKQGIEVGDILVSSWGYDQTNVDFYQVVRATAKSAWIRRIASNQVRGSEGFMSASVVPVKDQFIDHDEKGRLHRIKSHGPVGDKTFYLSLTSYSSAHLWEGKPKYQSWYA
jgi:hypothetical protein